MSKKGSNFFEEHAEKIVLGIVGLVFLWLLITRVLISPNYIQYNNKKFSARDVDGYINKQAKLLENKLNQKPKEGLPYNPRVDEFAARMDSTISDIDVSLYLPQPNRNLIGGATDNRVYSIPSVGAVNDIKVGYIRAVAYMPTEAINEKNTYFRAENKPNDIDFVTVEAKFDVAGLYERFYACFAGDNVQEERWRDPFLANLIFAAVQLQRQEKLADGSWGDWQIVPRTKIDHRKEMFEVIERVEDLPPGGMEVRLLRFNDPQLRVDMLQPEAYRIASPKKEWFPPSLYKDFVRYQREIEAQEKREARTAEREERERERVSSRPERRRLSETRTRSGRGTDDDVTGPGGPSGGGSLRRGSVRRSRSDRDRTEKAKEPSRTIDDIYDEFDKIKITMESDFARMQEPLLFWACDDSVKPGKSYRYRIRLGVFNPIAETNQFSKQDEHLKNTVILWSRFSDITETVEVPASLYLFPSDIQESAKTITVQISKYVLGYWYSRDFTVKPGEIIGRIGEPGIVDVEKGGIVPETVDYSSGAVFVDAVAVNDWSGTKNLRARHYFDMLYSLDGTDIERIPIKTRYWSEKLQNKFKEIKKTEKELREAFRPWNSRVGRKQIISEQLLDEELID